MSCQADAADRQGRLTGPARVGRALHGASVEVLFPADGFVGGKAPQDEASCVVWFFLNRHRFGAHVYLTGDNIESARLMGVNVGRTKIIASASVGLVAAFARFIVSAEVQFFWPTLGNGYLLYTLTAVFLGGTSVFGGAGTVFGTFVASFVTGAINAGIVAAGLTNFWNYFIYGLIIVGSVSIQTVLTRRLK